MSTPEAQPDPLLELAAAEAADNETIEQPQPDAQGQPEPEPEAESAEDQPPWAQHGFRDPEAVYQAWQNASQKIQEQGAELGELRQLQRNMATQQQQQQPAYQQQETFPDGTPIFSPDQVQEAIENGILTDVQGQAVMAEQAARIQAIAMEERIMQRLAPLEQARMHQGAQNTLDELNVAVGDDVAARHHDLIARLITEDRAHYAHPQHGSRRLIEAVKSAEWDLQTGAGSQQPRDQQGRYAPADTYVEGGSSAQPHVKAGATRLDPEDQGLISSLVPQRAVDEAGIPIPWAR
jgi:hypothetical protein